MNAPAARVQSYWVATAPATDFPPLAGDLEVDVAIVGGGIVGITAARSLKDAGLRVAVLEARRVGQQVTGKSTAKITSQHNLIYHRLAQKHGEQSARTYAEANQAAIGLITELARRHRIDCDLEQKAAFTFARNQESVAAIEREVDIARRLGLPAAFSPDPGLPFPVAGAIRFDAQAQFHPCKYVAGLARTIPGEGCHVFEHTRATELHPDRVVTASGVVSARHVIVATHLPLGQIGLFYAEVYPEAHPALVARIDAARAPDGMFISVEQPTHSVRTHRDASGTMRLVLIGTRYKPGHTDAEREAFADLERFGREHFGVTEYEYRWVNEDYTPMDALPFIGRSSSLKDAFLVATGFNAWGITNGTAAGVILGDLVVGRDNPWAKLYDATRISPRAGGRKFAHENLHVAEHLASGYLARRPHSLEELGRGEAAILELDGRRVAAYREPDGRVHTVSAVCSHMGCIVGWNETERTWDCPCHGSRFELDGEVQHGPATQPLERR